jgi:hypothetical protein
VISLARRPLRARWLPSTGLSNFDSVRRNAKWRKSAFSSCRRYPVPRYGPRSTGQRVVRASRSWPTSSRNDAASRSSMKHMAGSPPCRGSMPGRLERCPGLRPHRHELVDGGGGSGLQTLRKARRARSRESRSRCSSPSWWPCWLPRSEPPGRRSGINKRPGSAPGRRSYGGDICGLHS